MLTSARGLRGVGAAVLFVVLVAGPTSVRAAAGPGSTAPEAPAGRLSGPLATLASGGAERRAVPQPDLPLRSVGPDDQAADGPGTLIQTTDGVLVQVFSDALTPSVVDGVRAAGGRIVDVDQQRDIATASVAPDELQAVAGVDGVRYVREVLEPLSGRMDQPAGVAAAGSAAAVPAPCGAALSEGDAQLDAVGLRNAWGVEGAGVTVGILSDTWDLATDDATSWADDVASGDIPGAANPCAGPGRTTPATVLAEGPAGNATDEGRAMGQIVHDLAPAAGLSFATAFTGDLAFAHNIRALHSAGAGVIVDDVYYLNEPAYQNGPIGVAVEDVVAGGAAYASALGNETVSVGGHPVSSYEAPAFRPTSCPIDLPGSCHDFDPGPGVDSTFGVTVPAGGQLRMSLKWNEPWNGVVTDLNLYFLVDGQILGSSTEDNLHGSQQPFEFVNDAAGDQPVDVDVVVQRVSGTNTPRFKLEHVRSTVSGSERTVGTGGDVIGPNAIGHPVAPDALGVGAIPYSDATTPEPYSNRGPATWYWGPAVGSTPAPALSAPLVLDKPDVVATDGGRTTFFYDRIPPFTTPRFYGTSAAAPHVAAVAALLRSCNASLTPKQIGDALRHTAAPVAHGDPASVGAGRVDAKAAGDAVCLPPPTTPTFDVSDASVDEGNGGALVTAKALTFTIRLRPAAAATTSVRYATANGTAVAPGDYTAKAATKVTFAKGQTSATVSVPVKGDAVFEPDETMSVALSGPVGAAIGDGVGIGSIVNDDVAPVVPAVSIADASVAEGNGGWFAVAKTLVFTVQLSAPAPGNVSITYQTANGSAVAPGDYTAKAPTVLTFKKGETSKTVTITVKGDAVVEPNEVLFVALTKPVGVVVSKAMATGTIVNDD